jgi:endonuclease/exonuclease/phosphatase family metal-dependent hydrolase
MLVRWLVALATLAGLSGVPCAARAAPPVPANQTGLSAGRLKLLTYNVAGLPEGLSESRPTVNLPLIGKLLNRYDLALVQEDFAYPLMLRQAILHAHGSPPFVRGERLHFGDGLSQFSRMPFFLYERERWAACHGVLDSYFDCLTPKGFTYSRQELAPGVTVDVYNLHLDAGGSPGDRSARADQLAQLAQAVKQRSAGHAVILGGDFNIRGGSELERLAWFEGETELVDTCQVLRCKEPSRIDRILFRSSDALTLTPRSWRVDPRFVDAQRRPLSDHLAVAVELEWTANGPLGAEAAATPAPASPALKRRAFSPVRALSDRRR